MCDSFIECDCGHQIDLVDFCFLAWCPHCDQKWLIDQPEDQGAEEGDTLWWVPPDCDQSQDHS